LRKIPYIAVYKGENYDIRFDETGNLLRTVTIDPRNREHWERFFSTIKEEPALETTPMHVLYLWGLDTPEIGTLTLRQLELQQKEISVSLLHIAKALIRQFNGTALWLVTRNAQPVETPEMPFTGPLSPLQSTIWGMGKVFALEHPEIHGRIIDLGNGEPEEQGDRVFAEITTGTDWDRAAYREGKRYVPRLKREISPAPPAPGKVEPVEIIRPGGTYLITGGTGALGLIMARWLKEKGATRIILNSRRQPGPAAAALIEELRVEGVDALFLKGDVSNEEDAKELVLGANTREAPLFGVIHAAGMLADGMLIEQNWDNFKKVFKPKISGTWSLYKALRHVSLDFLLLFSSAASLLGNRGQANYAAANAFQDAVAYYGRMENQPVLAIDWGPWGGAGMAVSSASVKAFLGKQGFEELEAADGLPVLEKLLNIHRTGIQNKTGTAACTRTAIIDCNWDRYAGYVAGSVGSENVYDYLENLVRPNKAETTENTDTIASGILEQLEAANAEQRKELLIAHVRDIAAAVSGADSVDIKAALIDQGFDSLMAVEFRNELVKKLQLSLPVTLLYNYPSVEELALHLDTLLPFAGATPEPQQESGDTDGETTPDYAHLDEMSPEELEALIYEELENEG
ncbi:MAG: SDR family NAD(P)-dependent oxidoreductase, partial [bacterium]|nr:SDR family NAD(P)-dependent oxidoreductase [bacterium]